jgi:hypothetical protein
MGRRDTTEGWGFGGGGHGLARWLDGKGWFPGFDLRKGNVVDADISNVQKIGPVTIVKMTSALQ